MILQRILFVCILLTWIGLSLALSIHKPKLVSTLSKTSQKEQFLITTYFDYFNCKSMDYLKSITIEPVTSSNKFYCQNTQCYTTSHWDITMNYRCVYSELSDLFKNYSMPLAIEYQYDTENGGNTCKDDLLQEITAYPAADCIERNHIPITYECKNGYYIETLYNASTPTTEPCQSNNIIKQTKIPINTCTTDGYMYNCNQ
ncbi:predicted protein [Naegleria gruberi]|uniref:Predicted protein n=1 Tax=Naegleria gruberi TaxID=5762 RepID=D2VGG6_NAEGR|nr:uncharacterized protein NAEGRDRAFT_67969 [Naegleria gruberi]EFC43961.1 predicted protein [Naegleria gruberi]|eukprot:XP_002676705.1 predicted protein [Naegleria gruberi strain NEG-M]